jgi:hypothetical protein
MDKVSEKEMINFFYNAMPYIGLLFDSDVSMALTDTEKYLYTSMNENLKLNSKEGDAVPSGGAVADAIRGGREIIKIVPENVYGVAFKSYAIPIKE